MPTKQLTQKVLINLISYNFITGLFTHRVNKPNRVKAGDLATRVDKKGYLIIKVKGRQYSASRLVFLYLEGKFPTNQADHINRVKVDNMWCNLRDVTNKENCYNKSNNNTYIGVGWDRGRNKWLARTNHNKKLINLGRYKTHLAACYACHSYNITRGIS